MQNIRTALIFGGNSPEHEISIVSAGAVASAIDRSKRELVPLYVSHDGRWYGGATAMDILSLEMSELLKHEPLDVIRQQLDARCSAGGEDLFGFDFRQERIDVAFPVIHGSYGEDGRLQGLLDMFAIPYVGCGVEAAALTMDKAATKVMAMHAGIAVADFFSCWRHEYLEDPGRIEHMAMERFRFPFFVKPAHLGSSVGITKVHGRKELCQALEEAFMLDNRVLCEEMIEGREIEVAVLGNDEPYAALPGEIEPGGDFYDFRDKYVKSHAQFFIPARVDGEVLEAIRGEALKTYRVLGCRGMSRIDFFVNSVSNLVVLNEVNTIPGFTPISMFPKMMAASGMDFPELVEKLLSLALEKKD
ncbi:D-alanine--D-alanine ligase family protein [Prosthecochloris vibrioformis]|uniref:D-alanine--D-alanine ligase n=1 Tax=Prosthecochloris vibrioformis TaxID=1098 RepID=A0A5C4S2J8_PROVB|nr:D-alanine--D-alanine ligase family protein [Prosthecochloris vibrioformis]TNJ37352.1 D-alanine--D-alanine ligase [Prosthecochloris vibrioformis]